MFTFPLKRRAEILWGTLAETGRKAPPSGSAPHPYSAPVRFSDVSEPWPGATVWSLVVERADTAETSADPLRWIADIYFLFPDAPHDELRPGRQFELYEGRRCVARGKILF